MTFPLRNSRTADAWGWSPYDGLHPSVPVIADSFVQDLLDYKGKDITDDRFW
jgi:hypothetical protein